jgi:hypothetical protein
MVLAFAGEILDRATEAEQSALVVAGCDELLALLIFNLGVESSTALRLGRLGLPAARQLIRIRLEVLRSRDRPMRSRDAIKDLPGQLTNGAARTVEAIGMGVLRKAGVGHSDFIIRRRKFDAECFVVVLIANSIGQTRELDTLLFIGLTG